MNPLRRALLEDFGNVPPIVILGTFIGRLIPQNTGFRLRRQIMRMGGWRIDPTAILTDVPHFSGTGPIHTRLSVGADSYLNARCQFDLSDEIRIESAVYLAQDVMILTSTHDVGTAERRAGQLVTAPVRIERGAWIGARALILPGVTVGCGAIVAAGSVVTRDVAPNVLVAGIPARVVKSIAP